MKHNFTPLEICGFGQRLATAKLVTFFGLRSRSHNTDVLFPQTLAQYRWLKKVCGTTYNCIILHLVDAVENIVPELKEYIKPTKNNRFCRIDLVVS